jgi:NAD-dependent deacetylase
MSTRVESRDAVRLAELIRGAESVVVLTGAGVSVPSGIPDFRSPGTGLWENVNPMEVAHIDVFRREPDRFWHFYSQRFTTLGEKEPNDAHHAIAELERRGLVEGVVTQNIDRLHRAAGSENVIEVHGSIDECVCLECGGRVTLERVLEIIDEHPGAPECAACISPLKPNVVLFGELLPEEAISDAYGLASNADLLIGVGSSLEVYPVASLPRVTLDSGGRVALVTQGPTPYDRDAEVKLSGDVVDELGAVLAALDSPR